MVGAFLGVAFGWGSLACPDLSLGSPETETPVNPYSLLEAVNRSSDTAHTAWLIFLAIMAYFMIAVAGVTHRDLLLETPVALPVLQVNIQLAQFFQFAPRRPCAHAPRRRLAARAARAGDARVRSRHPASRGDRQAHPSAAPRAQQLLLRAGDCGAVSQQGHERVPARHELADARRAARGAAALHPDRYLPYHDETTTWSHRIASSPTSRC